MQFNIPSGVYYFIKDLIKGTFQMYQNRGELFIIHSCCLPVVWTFHPIKSSITNSRKTQCIPEIVNNRSPSSQGLLQWIKTWFADSLLDLWRVHSFTNDQYLFIRLSRYKCFPTSTPPPKKKNTSLEAAHVHQTIFFGNCFKATIHMELK